eukprot:4640131-Amphidinium_carterae.1
MVVLSTLQVAKTSRRAVRIQGTCRHHTAVELNAAHGAHAGRPCAKPPRRPGTPIARSCQI